MNHDYLNRLKDLDNKIFLMGCSSASVFSLKKVLRIRKIEYEGLATEYLSSGR